MTDILCIGSVLWDIIGRANTVMRVGTDVPGRITRLPGGVVLNIAMTLAQFGLRPVLLSAVGRDMDGDTLLQACTEMGLVTDYVYRPADLPTDAYMAIEGSNGLIAAVADAHSLEHAGAKILAPLQDGRLPAPYRGGVALDGNLTLDLLTEIARSALFAQAELYVAPASPGKADRLQPFLAAGRGTLYVNLEEAGLLCGATFADARTAAEALLARGAAGVLVTNGAGDACAATQTAPPLIQTPPEVTVARVTGAGDTFMAAHIAAKLSGAAPDQALHDALAAAAAYVSGKSPT